jgi:glycosyltransferase involved in cell wall biosynthesis
LIVLLVHPHACGQFLHVARGLVARGDTVHFICRTVSERLDEVHYHLYTDEVAAVGALLADDFVQATARGAGVEKVCEQLLQEGIRPDVVIGHGGWGETLYLKDVFPRAAVVNYLEFYYQLEGADYGFDPEFDPIFVELKRLQSRNATIAMSALRADVNLTPTPWQRSVLPKLIGQGTILLHEGINTREAAPNPRASFTLPGRAGKLTRSTPVITYVSRSLEPYRGFPSFMRALPKVLRARPDAQVVIVGDEGTSYGAPLPPGSSYKAIMLDELRGQLPLERIHFCGTLPRRDYLRLLQISAAHVYLTYPLFLSWSCLEAMASACTLIGSRTGPVTDFVQDGTNGVLVDFFDTEGLSAALIGALRSPATHARLGTQARATVKTQLDAATVCVPKWLRLIDQF